MRAAIAVVVLLLVAVLLPVIVLMQGPPRPRQPDPPHYECPAGTYMTRLWHGPQVCVIPPKEIER